MNFFRSRLKENREQQEMCVKANSEGKRAQKQLETEKWEIYLCKKRHTERYIGYV